MTLNDSDLQTLLPRRQLEFGKNTRQLEREMDQWHEQGPWLLIFILPFAALAFRRGWLLSLFLVVMIQLPPAEALAAPSQQPASSYWKTPNQLGAEAFARQDYRNAEQLFADPQWQGSAAYRAGDYEAAAQHFAQSDSATAHYNRGNALARLGQLEAASKAYDEALKRNPDLADARANKSLVEKLARQQQQQPSAESQASGNEQNQQPEQTDQQSASQSPAQNSDSGSQSANQPASRQSPAQADNQSSAQQQKQQDKPQQSANTGDITDSEQRSQTDSEQPPEQQSQSADKNPLPATASENDKQDQQQNSQPTALFEPQLTEEQQQAMEQWLRRIPDDPSVLLKNKFNYQYQKNRQNNEFLPQQEDEAIW